MHPPIIQSLITHFSRFPGIGPKTAERFVFYLLKQPKEDLKNLSLAIQNLKDKIKFCSNCFNLCENDLSHPSLRYGWHSPHSHSPHLHLCHPSLPPHFWKKYGVRYGRHSPVRTEASVPVLCSICANPKRDQTTICIVAEVQDLETLEKTHQYQGVYHILGGTLNALEGVTPEKLRIKELIDRINSARVHLPIREVILALDPNLEGETTALYLIKLLKSYSPPASSKKRDGIRITRLARGLPMGSDLEYADEITLSNALRERKDV